MTVLDLSNPHVTAFGAMDDVYGPGTAAAMQAWPHGWEFYGRGGGWRDIAMPHWSREVPYRAKPAPSPEVHVLYWRTDAMAMATVRRGPFHTNRITITIHPDGREEIAMEALT